jgi:hypothetical protein
MTNFRLSSVSTIVILGNRHKFMICQSKKLKPMVRISLIFMLPKVITDVWSNKPLKKDGGGPSTKIGQKNHLTCFGLS